jgi:hypothetical protein
LGILPNFFRGNSKKNKNFFASTKNFLARNKGFLASTKKFLARNKGFLASTKGFLARNKKFLASAKGFLARNKSFPVPSIQNEVPPLDQESLQLSLAGLVKGRDLGRGSLAFL